jgi:hypothetical protein
MGEMLWDPTLDPDVLISEFLLLYYGPVGSPWIKQCRLMLILIMIQHVVSETSVDVSVSI